MRKIFFPVFILCISVLAQEACADNSHGPRQTGEEVLDELLLGRNKFVMSVGSNGCTAKSSFTVAVKKEEGLTPDSPHYALSIKRVKADECKAIVEGGTLVLFDLEKDLGIKGRFTYSVTNQVYSSSGDRMRDESLWSMIEKNLTFNLSAMKEIRPEPYETFVMDHGYFTCLIPTKWQRERDTGADEKAGIFEIKLTKPDKAKPVDGEKYFVPDPVIYVGFYTAKNMQGKTYESFIKDYEALSKKRKNSEKSRYESAKKFSFTGREAIHYHYEVYQEVPRGPLFATKYWLKARFIVVKAKSNGFFVLAYKSPAEFYDQFLPVFEEVVNSFKTKDTEDFQ
ncbi:MAG: hypothetical protein EG822_16575 [Deltaproteobacteria bacterium]|nr:hypothetical protein [Deltaproteobacteria bacterium]TLN02031.1 MAG: hypothetical protein FDZ73_13400 [bacterium]